MKVKVRARARAGARAKTRATATATARVRLGARAHRIVQRAAGRVGHHEAGRLLHARSVQADHVRVAHARERTHLAAHGLGDGAQRRLARLALVAAALLLDRDLNPLPAAEEDVRLATGAKPLA